MVVYLLARLVAEKPERLSAVNVEVVVVIGNILIRALDSGLYAVFLFGALCIPRTYPGEVGRRDSGDVTWSVPHRSRRKVSIRS